MQNGAVGSGSAGVAHPVYPVAASPERIEALKEAVAPLMGMGEEEMVGLAPDRTGFRFTGCPHCDEGSHQSQLVWTIEDPHHVTCRYCGMGFPNETYPEDRVLKVINPIGEEVAYPYWEDDKGEQYFFGAKGWWCARFYFASRAKDLGELYQMTGERAYARRAALILSTFARYYPGFLVCLDEVHTPKAFYREPPFPRRGGKWGEWRYTEIPTDLVFAYDWIYDSGELEQLSDEVGVDVKERIENDFFRGGVRQDDFHGPLYTNASPSTYEGYAVFGRVLGEPGLVHEAVRRSRGLFERWFFVDGFWCQGSVDYHRYTMRGMQQALDALRGYSDPPDYVDPKDKARFDNLDMERDFPIVERAVRVSDICRYPDGRGMSVHDSWPRTDDRPAPERAVSTLLTGLGHAWLGRGTGEEQVQVHLHFSDGAYGHSHADMLNLILFARGQELLPDVGYTHSRYRHWSISTLCHNTVVIDEEEQFKGDPKRPGDGQVLAFETAFEAVQWVEASGERAYPGLAAIYRRALMLVDAGDGDVYVVDLFRAGGGSRHDWVMHGSVDRDGRAEVSVPMEPYGEHMLPGVEVRLPENAKDPGEAAERNPNYGFFQNVSRGEVIDGVSVNIALSESPVGIRTHLPGLAGAEVFLGDAPSVRRAEENDAVLDRYRMPIFLVRREGPPPLSSCFAAVHEPYEGEPFVEEVSVDNREDAVVLSVRHHGVTDHIVHRTDPNGGELHAGDLHLRGEVGFVRERDGVPEMMGLWGGAELRWRDSVLSGDGTYEGEVRGSLRKEDGDPYDGLRVTGKLPEGEVLKGATAIVTFGDGSTLGYRVAEARRAGGGTHLVLADDPGIVVDGEGMRHLTCPRHEIPGQVRYRVRTSALSGGRRA